jgi:hypothetical protein
MGKAESAPRSPPPTPAHDLEFALEKFKEAKAALKL